MSSLTLNTATTCVASGDFQLRVYFQDSEDYVREACGGAWTGGTINDRLFRAKPNTPLAAIAWGSMPHVRILTGQTLFCDTLWPETRSGSTIWTTIVSSRSTLGMVASGTLVAWVAWTSRSTIGLRLLPALGALSRLSGYTTNRPAV